MANKNRNYARGYAFELRFVAKLRELGMVASRTPGSHGSYDVIAMRHGQGCLFQLKTGEARVTKEEIAALREDADKAGARPFAVYAKRGGFEMFFVSPKLELIPVPPLALEEPF